MPGNGQSAKGGMLARIMGAALLASGLAVAAEAAQIPDKDQDRIGAPATPAPATPLRDPNLLEPGETQPVQPPQGELPGMGYDDLLLDMKDARAIELTAQMARRALDAFAAIRGKYDDKGLADYPTLQEFADKTEAGKQMQEEIRKFGFANVAEWNLVIMNLGFAYTSVLEGSDAEIRNQIRDAQADPRLSEDKRRKIIKALRILIPSPNNRKIAEELMNDPVYSQKLKLLDAEE